MQYEYSNANLLLFDKYPSHWQLIRVRNLLKEENEQVGKRTTFPLLSLTKGGVIFRDTENGKGKFPKDFESYKVVVPGNIIFCLFDIDETPRTVGLSSVGGMITGAYDVFSINTSLSLPEFIYYYFLAVDDNKALRPFYSGLRKVVQMPKFLGIQTPVPPLDEQKKIVEFLSTKTLSIDAQQRERERELRLLDELKQTEIANVVTRGLNPDVPMKDSGIPWIGQIPAHWEIKYLFQLAKEHCISNKEIHHQNLLSLSYGRIVRKDINTTDGLLPESFDTYQVVEPGNIILRLTDLQNDHKSLRVGLVTEEGIITSAYVCLEINQDFDPVYFYNMLHSYDLKKVFYSMGGGLRQNLNYQGLRKLETKYMTKI